MKRRVMIQADESLLERARQLAGERGITFPQLVRDAIEREVDRDPDQPLSCVGAVDTGGRAREREYRPDAWR